MKHLMLWMMALAALPGSALQAQNITGNWQGTLQAGPQKVRVVFKIALENDKLKATALHRRPTIAAYRDHDHTGRFDRKNDNSRHKRQI